MTNDIKVFGMKAESGRWIYVLLGLIINICMGTVYSWSVFKKPIETLFQANATQSALPYIFFLAFFAALMPFTGSFLDKYGPKFIMVLGSIIVGLGWILASKATGITFLVIAYGIIAGSGVGIAYGGPISVSAKWFPDAKGLAVGLTVLGFGLSALITAPLARALIASKGVLPTFSILGIIFLIVLVVLSLPMRFPPAGWKPAGWSPPQAIAGVKSDLTTGEMFGTGSFYGLWLCYIIGALGGLMAIGISSPVGQEIIQLDAKTAAMTVSVFAIFNGIGRPIFGWLTDKITPRYAAIVSFIVLLLASLGMKSAGAGSTTLFVVCFSGFWLVLGGWLAIAPTSTASFFGSKYYGLNYGFVFTAYGIGAIIGNLLAGQLKVMLGSYAPVFNYTALFAIAGIVIAFLLMKQPKK